MARQQLEQAIQIDPTCADALAALGYLALEEFRFDFNPIPDQGDPLDRAQALAHQAYDIDSTCILALLTLSQVYYHRGQPERGQEFGERGLQLNPNNTEFLCEYGFNLGLIGDWGRGLALIEKAMALHPRFNTLYYIIFALHAVVEGRDEQALAYAVRVKKPNLFWDPLFRAAILGLLGRTAEAKDAVVELERLYPDIRASLNDEFAKWPMNEHALTRLAEGLGRTGLMTADR